ncbi:MAG: hypothetical protein CMH50_09245 [Myxococcales bacterium]|nr:hypothetical protein [Myxococcales bacterium]
MSSRSNQRIPTWAVIIVLMMGGFAWYQLMQRYGKPQSAEWKLPENKPVWDQVAEIQLDEARYGKLPDPQSLDPRATGWTEDLHKMPEAEARARIQRYHVHLQQLHASRRKVLNAMRQRNEPSTITDPLDLMSTEEYALFLKQAEQELLSELRPLWLLIDGGNRMDMASSSNAADAGTPEVTHSKNLRQPDETTHGRPDGGAVPPKTNK